MLRRNDVSLTTKLRDVLYNQCKPNPRDNFLFYPTHGWDNVGEIRISIPSEKLGIAYPVGKKSFFHYITNELNPI